MSFLRQLALSDARLPALDGLRGVAILVVLIHNFSLLEVGSGTATRLVQLGLDAGWVGVTLFFVLSGFLITRILLQAGGGPGVLRHFYLRRAVRILPLYFGLLFVFFVLWPLIGGIPAEVQRDQPHQLWYWLMLSNWTAPYGVGGVALPHLWSIAVEEQFYLVWPFLVLGRSPRQVFRLCIGVAVLSLAVRVVMSAIGAPPDAIYQSSIARMDALALGGAVAAACAVPSWLATMRRAARWLPAAALVLLLLGAVATRGYPRLLPIGQMLGYSVLAAVFALMVMAVAGLSAGQGLGREPVWHRVLCSPVLRRFGYYSYAMYLVHQPLHALGGLALMDRIGLKTTDSMMVSALYGGVMIILTLAIGASSYHLIERRLLARRPSMPTMRLPAAPI